MEVAAVSCARSTSHEVQRVLAGTLAYDAASVEAQRRVRDVWDQRMARCRSRLDLASEFREQGRSWSECDDDGNVVLRR